MRPFPALFLAASLLLPTTLRAQSVLEPGTTVTTSVTGDGTATHRIRLDRAGFLTVVARSENGVDIRLTIRDDEGQVLPDGHVDGDVGGDLGAEQVVLAVPTPGDYLVAVETYGMGGATYTLGASFLASDLVATAPDPDGKPSGARPVAVGQNHEDSLDPAGGDAYDWFRIDVEQAGVLTVLTRSDDDGDLRIDLFAEGDFGEPVDSSDQDQNGALGNESISVDVAPGESWWVRVGPSQLGYGSAARYRLASGLIPG